MQLIVQNLSSVFVPADSGSVAGAGPGLPGVPHAGNGEGAERHGQRGRPAPSCLCCCSFSLRAPGAGLALVRGWFWCGAGSGAGSSVAVQRILGTASVALPQPESGVEMHLSIRLYDGLLEIEGLGFFVF